jgi:hypothetical protein
MPFAPQFKSILPVPPKNYWRVTSRNVCAVV